MRDDAEITLAAQKSTCLCSLTCFCSLCRSTGNPAIKAENADSPACLQCPLLETTQILESVKKPEMIEETTVSLAYKEIGAREEKFKDRSLSHSLFSRATSQSSPFDRKAWFSKKSGSSAKAGPEKWYEQLLSFVDGLCKLCDNYCCKIQRVVVDIEGPLGMELDVEVDLVSNPGNEK